MNKLNNNFSEISEKDLQSIDGGSILPYIGTAIAIYDAYTDFCKGFDKGMTDPE